MKQSQMVLSGLAALSLVTTSACVTDPNTGKQRISRPAVGAGIGAVGGLLVGGLIGGSGAELLGAGIGGIGGAVIGSKNERQTRERRGEQTQGRDADLESGSQGSQGGSTQP